MKDIYALPFSCDDMRKRRWLPTSRIVLSDKAETLLMRLVTSIDLLMSSPRMFRALRSWYRDSATNGQPPLLHENDCVRTSRIL